MVRRRVTSALIVCGLAGGGGLPAVTASAAGLRVRDRLTWTRADGRGWRSPPTRAQFFATDGGNELNSDTDDSTGRIRFQRVSCGRRLRIAFRFTGRRVASEFSDGEPLTVRGSFSASASA